MGECERERAKLELWWNNTRWTCSRETNYTAALDSAYDQTTTHSSYYARREQWLPTRLLVAPRSLNDELRLLCANNSLAQPALPLGILLETAGLDHKPRRCARSPPPLRHPRDAALWNRKPPSDAPKARFPPHNHKSIDGARDQKSTRQRGSLRHRDRSLVYHPRLRYGVQQLHFCLPHRIRHHWPAECPSLRKPNMRLLR